MKKKFGFDQKWESNLDPGLSQTPAETIKKNLERRAPLVNENLVFLNKFPMPSWIELSIIDVCNRSCVFCPKSNESIAPNTFQQMSRKIIEKISSDLKAINFNGSITLCGYGEPLLHKDINFIVAELAKSGSVEIVTNGDTISKKIIDSLYSSGAKKILISMYDGPEQVDKFEKIMSETNVPDNFVILRDRWYKENEDFGVKLTNRSGTINIGIQKEIKSTEQCFYPAYQILIDWNGDVFLCPQDWQRRMTMGNVMQQDIYEIWTGKILTKYRKNLLKGLRCLNPCLSCNADGKLLGKNHAKAWKEIYS